MKLTPLFDRVVLKQLVAEETTKSGIVLPGQAKEKPQQAEVIAVGPGGVVDGKEITMQVKVGDKVIYSKYSGTEVELDNEKYVIVKQNDNTWRKNMPDRNIKITLQYDGSRYDGWQKQENTDKTIQGKLEQILEKMAGQPRELA